MGPSYSRGTAYRNTPAGAMFNTTLSAVKSANGPGSRAAAETAKSAHGLESVYSDPAAMPRCRRRPIHGARNHPH
jgi:hypothetical protein